MTDRAPPVLSLAVAVAGCLVAAVAGGAASAGPRNSARRRNTPNSSKAPNAWRACRCHASSRRSA